MCYHDQQDRERIISYSTSGNLVFFSDKIQVLFKVVLRNSKKIQGISRIIPEGKTSVHYRLQDRISKLNH